MQNQFKNFIQVLTDEREPDPCPPRLLEHLQQNHFAKKILRQLDIHISLPRLAEWEPSAEGNICYF